MTVCNDSFVPVLGVVLLFRWGAVGFCWFLRASGLFPRFSMWVKRTRLWGRMLVAVLFAALSGPAGTRVLEFTQNQTINASRNIDMATFKDDSTWPVNTFFGTRWLHSDFKAVALPNVFGLFNEFCTKGNLK